MDISEIVYDKFSRIDLDDRNTYIVVRHPALIKRFDNFKFALWLNHCLNLEKNQEPIKFSEFRKKIDETFNFHQYALQNGIGATIYRLWYDGIKIHHIGTTTGPKYIDILSLNYSLGFLIIRPNLIEKINNIIENYLGNEELITIWKNNGY